MLPNALYKSLPYLYIAIGVFFGTVIESNIIFVSSALLMTAGFLVLWMRHHPVEHSSTGYTHESPNLKSRDWSDVFQADQERRRLDTPRAFPLIDNDGNMIAFDRRVSDRKITDVA